MPTIHRFYTPAKLPQNGTVTLTPEESAHAIKVLRLKPGDKLLVMDGLGGVAEATILPPPKNRRIHDAICAIQSVTFTPPPKRSVHLYVAPPKGNNMDLLLKEATELGVSSITPVLCRYGVARTEKNCKDSWTRNLITAIKQSANPWLPILNTPALFEQAIKEASEYGYFGAVPKEGDGQNRSHRLTDNQEISLWIGPEGGFSDDEEAQLRAKGLRPLTVGNWILRVETAVPALLACIQMCDQN